MNEGLSATTIQVELGVLKGIEDEEEIMTFIKNMCKDEDTETAISMNSLYKIKFKSLDNVKMKMVCLNKLVSKFRGYLIYLIF
jgi:hypothetical protein